MQTTSCFLVMVITAVLSFNAYAEEQLDLADHVADLDAQVQTIKNDLASVTSLATQERASAFNPSISAIGDVIGQVGFNLQEHHHEEHHGHDHSDEKHKHDFKNGVMAREIEFQFTAEVDPYANGVVIVGIHPHNAHDAAIHLEEAFVNLKTWPGLGFAPLGMTVKAGKFRTAFGRINRVHLHNTPQITYPLATRMFLGEEGYGSSGVSANVAFNPTTTTSLNLFAESVFLNKTPMQKKGAEETATGVFHVWWNQELGPFHFLDIGASTLLGGKSKKESGLFWLAGADVHYSYIPTGYGQNPIFLFGDEVYLTERPLSSSPLMIGNYTWAQVRLFGATFFGARYDFAPNEELNGFQHALGGYLTHYTTEFLRFRLGYEHGMPEINSFDGDHRVMLSLMFVLGSHPVEPYFVNR